jgi:outer membrane protein OmpA-like peptidoglycan-associated protein
MFTKSIAKDLAGKAAGMLGESPQATETAVANIFPALLGGMLGMTKEPSGAEKLFKMVTGPDIDTGLLDDVGSLLGGGSQTDSLMSTGSSLLNGLFGGKSNAVFDSIANVAGISSSSAGKLFRLAAPLGLSFLKKHAVENKLDAGGLVNLLLGQKDHLKTGLDSRVTDAMGFGDVTSFLNSVEGGAPAAARQAAAQVSQPPPPQPQKSGPNFGKWLAIAAAILIALWLLRSCGDDAERAAENAMESVEKTAEKAVDAASETAAAVGEAASDAADAVSRTASDAVEAVKEGFASLTLPTGETIDVLEDGFVESWVNYLQTGDGDNRFVFDALEFETDSARLAGISDRQLDAVASVLKAYPARYILVEGHTDNTGDSAYNAQLSLDRAKAVREALIGRGIEPGRISAVGSGDANPIASNDTEEGRAENRRVELVVVDPA